MKKVFFTLTIAILSIFAITGCDKTEDVDPGKPPMATLKGIVRADFDANETKLTPMVSGTKLYFEINAEELVKVADEKVQYETLIYETTIGANGEYSIELPASYYKAVTVNVKSDDLLYEYNKADNTKTEKIYYLAGISTTINADRVTVFDFDFASKNRPSNN